MNVYLAGSFKMRDEFKAFRALVPSFITICSRWLDQEEENLPMGKVLESAELLERFKEIAVQDLEDVKDSSVLILFSGASTTGGKHVELGYALTGQKKLFICGEYENIFQLACERVSSKELMLKRLVEYYFEVRKRN